MLVRDPELGFGMSLAWAGQGLLLLGWAGLGSCPAATCGPKAGRALRSGEQRCR